MNFHYFQNVLLKFSPEKMNLDSISVQSPEFLPKILLAITFAYLKLKGALLTFLQIGC